MTTSTFRPNSWARSISSPERSSSVAPFGISTKRSMSLSPVCSPRTTEPKSPARSTPYRCRIGSAFSLTSSMVFLVCLAISGLSFIGRPSVPPKNMFVKPPRYPQLSVIKVPSEAHLVRITVVMRTKTIGIWGGLFGEIDKQKVIPITMTFATYTELKIGIQEAFGSGNGPYRN